MPSANRKNLTSSFPICIPFISSSYLIALARNSKFMGIRMEGIDTFVSFLTLEEIVSVFCHLL
jgi:hypothetical protein